VAKNQPLKVLAGRLVKSDDVYSNVLVVREVVEKYGILN
jgi:hypothetical protein